LTSGITALAAGYSHTCAVTTSGGVKCWGENAYGQLGDGTTTQRRTPVDVSGLSSGAKALTVNGAHTCAVTVSGGVKCWGYNGYGQLGDGTTAQRRTPVDVSGLSSGVKAVAAGTFHTCAIAANGGIKCWGNNVYGQLGDGTTYGHTAPVDVSGLISGVTALAAGGAFTCAVTANGGIKCWGANSEGELGDGTTTQRNVPMDMSIFSDGVIALVAGGHHTCALTASGGVKCWGYNQYGQLGDSTTAQRSTPVDVNGLTSGVTALTAGWLYTCAVIASGGVKCWGDNQYGQLGDGTTTPRHAPVGVNGLTSGVTALTAGNAHTCAVTSSGGVKCWGRNSSGQLGDGTTTQRSEPVDVSGLTSGVTALATGYAHTCALTASGGVKCWGSNWAGQLGDYGDSRNTPVDVNGLTRGVTALAAGGSYSCALMENGGVKCWGGFLGTTHHMLEDMSGLTSGVTALAAGEGHACAVMANGGAKCWDNNLFGQLGDGTTSDRSTAVDVTGLNSGVTAVAVGTYHTCAVVSGYRVKCWGGDLYGQLGLGTITERWTPVDVVASVPARLVLNYSTGQPGSFFTLTGENFAANSQATVSINGTVVTTALAINETGSFIVFLDLANAEAGYYGVTVSAHGGAGTETLFALNTQAPLRQQEGGGLVLIVPTGIGVELKPVYLPLIQR
jgi:alpha-tubulin suppressor-like RCC1 family protein